MTDYLGHNRNYVLLFIVVIIIILLVLWALFRNRDDCKDGDCSDNSSDRSRDSRFTKESSASREDCKRSSESDKYSSDSYSERR